MKDDTLAAMGLFIRTTLLFWLLAAAIPAAELDGIWTGITSGRHGAKEDISFQFKIKGQALTGKMFGDEVDLPIEDGSLVGDKLKFSITIPNYYSGDNTKFVYTGTISGDSIELTRERILTPTEEPPEGGSKRTFRLTKLIS